MKNITTKWNRAMIFSVFQSDKLNETNKVHHEATLAKLQDGGFACKEVEGVYKGASELSIYCEPRDSDQVAAILQLCKTLNQESILDLDADRNARLLYLNASRFESLGVFTQVPEYIAKDEDSYTHDSINGGYYVCR